MKRRDKFERGETRENELVGLRRSRILVELYGHKTSTLINIFYLMNSFTFSNVKASDLAHNG